MQVLMFILKMGDVGKSLGGHVKKSLIQFAASFEWSGLMGHGPPEKI